MLVLPSRVAPIFAAAAPCPARHGRRDHRAQEAGGANAQMRVPGVRHTVRTARKWLETAGAPLFPIAGHGAMHHDPIDGEGDDLQT